MSKQMHFRGHFKGVLRGFHGGMLECFRVVLGGVLGWFRGVFDGAKWLPAPVYWFLRSVGYDVYVHKGNKSEYLGFPGPL